MMSKANPTHHPCGQSNMLLTPALLLHSLLTHRIILVLYYASRTTLTRDDLEESYALLDPTKPYTRNLVATHTSKCLRSYFFVGILNRNLPFMIILAMDVGCKSWKDRFANNVTTCIATLSSARTMPCV
jgi:hypothetical protein